jgi:predicted nucleic acid-binding Zn ribbon protein
MPKYCPECGKQIEGKKGSVDEVFKKRHARKGIKKAVMVVIFIFAAIAVIYVFYTYLELNGFISPMGSLSGTWEGSGTFTNNCDNPACKYVGTMNPPSVILVLTQNGNYVFGTSYS